MCHDGKELRFSKGGIKDYLSFIFKTFISNNSGLHTSLYNTTFSDVFL